VIIIIDELYQVLVLKGVLDRSFSFSNIEKIFIYYYSLSSTFFLPENIIIYAFSRDLIKAMGFKTRGRKENPN